MSIDFLQTFTCDTDTFDSEAVEAFYEKWVARYQGDADSVYVIHDKS